MKEYFPTYISNLKEKSIKIGEKIIIEQIDKELFDLLCKSGKHDRVSPFYPLSYDIIQYEDPLREIYLKSNYVFVIENKYSEIIDSLNFAFYIFSDFRNFLNFSIIKNNKLTSLDKLCSERKFIQRDDLLPNIVERAFLYGGQSDTISEEQFKNIIEFIERQNNYINNDRKKFIVQRIRNYNKIRKDSQVTLPFRFVEIVSILEGMLSHLGTDSLNKKFKDSFSALLNKFYDYDEKTLKSEFQAFYAIRSSLVHDGIIDWSAQELKKYLTAIDKSDNYSKTLFFFEKLEKYTKEILRIYFTKNIEFYCLIVIEK